MFLKTLGTAAAFGDNNLCVQAYILIHQTQLIQLPQTQKTERIKLIKPQASYVRNVVFSTSLQF